MIIQLTLQPNRLAFDGPGKEIQHSSKILVRGKRDLSGYLSEFHNVERLFASFYCCRSPLVIFTPTYTVIVLISVSQGQGGNENVNKKIKARDQGRKRVVRPVTVLYFCEGGWMVTC